MVRSNRLLRCPRRRLLQRACSPDVWLRCHCRVVEERPETRRFRVLSHVRNIRQAPTWPAEECHCTCILPPITGGLTPNLRMRFLPERTNPIDLTARIAHLRTYAHLPPIFHLCNIPHGRSPDRRVVFWIKSEARRAPRLNPDSDRDWDEGRCVPQSSGKKASRPSRERCSTMRERFTGLESMGTGLVTERSISLGC